MYSEMEKRKFSKDEKLQIIKEAGEQGVTITLGKYGIYPATFYSWKKKFETMGEEGFRHGMTVEHLKEIKRLEKENSMLKKLLAEKELEGRLKDEMIKKKYAQQLKKR
ncbi:MAG: transposase [Bacteroidales bacterium]|nr:transposase [Bacteroidales bacterium]